MQNNQDTSADDKGDATQIGTMSPLPAYVHTVLEENRRRLRPHSIDLDAQVTQRKSGGE